MVVKHGHKKTGMKAKENKTIEKTPIVEIDFTDNQTNYVVKLPPSGNPVQIRIKTDREFEVVDRSAEK
jgi:hypothetical protein